MAKRILQQITYHQINLQILMQRDKNGQINAQLTTGHI